MPELAFSNPLQLGPYLILALFMALLAALYTHTFYGCKRWFDRLPVRKHFRPAIGAFLTGLIAFALYFLVGRNQQVLAVLAFGYSAIQNAMTQDVGVLTAGILLTIALGKILTTEPDDRQRRIGRRVRALDGHRRLRRRARWASVFHHLWPGLVPHPASFVIVGMAGFFAAAAKTPFSTIIIVSEMTGGYHLLLPSLWVCTLSFILSDKQSIYASQVESRSLSPAHQGSYVRQVLAKVRVSQFFCRTDRHVAAAPARFAGQRSSTGSARLPYSVLPGGGRRQSPVGRGHLGRSPPGLAVAVAASRWCWPKT